MTELDRTRSGWGDRWAERENKRRRRAYEDAVEAWCLRGIRLLRLRAAAEELPAESTADLPVDLPDHEVVLAVQPDAELVDVEDGNADLPIPELAVIPVQRTKRTPRLPNGVRVTDAGAAVVTDRRVILFGREGDREWTYAELSGLAHHPAAPITLLHTIGGRPVAGLRVPLAAAVRFRLRLTMAYADFIGQRRVVLARLDEAVAANRRSRPPAPVVVTAEHAPARARLAHPAILAAAAVALVALPAYAMTADSSMPSGPHGAFRGGAPVTPGAVPSTGAAPSAAPTATSTTTPRTADPDVTSGAPTPGPASPDAPRSTPTPGLIDPAPGPTASPGMPVPIPADRCGAPENPYGYNYCGGTVVQDPAPDVCRWFTCVEGFWQGRGYLTVCEDGRLGMVGGRTGKCPERAGRKEPVYVYQPAAD